MRKAKIDEQNRYLVARQHEFRIAADIVTAVWSGFAEVEAVAVIGSVAKPLWKAVPRFREFRREKIEVWHECGDLDMALWVSSQHQLDKIRSAASVALMKAVTDRTDCRVSSTQIDVMLFQPGNNAYLGRLCRYSHCPKGKIDCFVPGCGTIAFNKLVPDFKPNADLLSGVEDAVLYKRGQGVIRSATTLPLPADPTLSAS